MYNNVNDVNINAGANIGNINLNNEEIDNDTEVEKSPNNFRYEVIMDKVEDFKDDLPTRLRFLKALSDMKRFAPHTWLLNVSFKLQ